MTTDDAPPIERSFLFAHALEMLQLEPSWSVRMYAVYNDLTDETTAALQEALRKTGKLRPEQLR